MNCLDLKIVVFTLINRLSQQKWNASFSDCDFFALAKTPAVLDYLHYFQPVINFLYLGIICSMWATACLVFIEMVHLRLVFSCCISDTLTQRSEIHSHEILATDGMKYRLDLTMICTHSEQMEDIEEDSDHSEQMGGFWEGFRSQFW